MRYWKALLDGGIRDMRDVLIKLGQEKDLFLSVGERKGEGSSRVEASFPQLYNKGVPYPPTYIQTIKCSF